MAVITVYGKTPDVGSAAFVAPNATLAGDVVLACIGSILLFGCSSRNCRTCMSMRRTRV